MSENSENDSTIVRVGKTCFGEVSYDINIEVDRILPHAKSASEIIKKADLYDPTVSQDKSVVNGIIRKNSENDTNSFASRRESIEKRMKAKGLNVTYDPNEANSFYEHKKLCFVAD